jgi:hypothetical protein
VKTKWHKQKNWRGRLGPRSNHASDSDDEESDVEVLNVIEHSDTEYHRCQLRIANPPKAAAALTKLLSMYWKRFLKDLKIEQVCVLTAEAPSVDAPPDATVNNSVSSSVSNTPGKHERPDGAEPKSARAERFASQSWEALQASGNPVYALAREYEDVFPDKIPATLPAGRGVQHEIDLVPGMKYCVARQWPLPRDQVQAIDDFFEGRRQAGHVRESISPHSSPTLCVKKATGGRRIVHAFNKLNDVTIPAQTPIPSKDSILDTMAGSEVYSAIDLTDGFYQIIMRESDVPLTAVTERHAVGMAGHAARAEERPCYIQPDDVTGTSTALRLCSKLLRRHLRAQQGRDRSLCRRGPS